MEGTTKAQLEEPQNNSSDNFSCPYRDPVVAFLTRRLKRTQLCSPSQFLHMALQQRGELNLQPHLELVLFSLENWFCVIITMTKEGRFSVLLDYLSINSS